MKRVLCVWLPNWPMQRLRATRPELDGCAVVLATSVSGKGQRVIACSPEAAALGVRRGIPLAEASSNRVTVEPYDRLADQIALQELAAWCEQFSPLVGIEDAEAPESLLLDATGLAALFGGEEALAKLAVQEFAARGYSARVAVADSIGIAWAVSHYGTPEQQSRISRSERRQVSLVAPRDMDAIGQLPIQSLRLSECSVSCFHRLGIHQVAEVLQLPRSGLRSRFDEEVTRRIDQLIGEKEEPIVAHRPLPELKAEWSFEPATAHGDTIEHVLQKLIQRVTTQLAGQDRGATELLCRLACQDAASVKLSVALFQPTAESRHLFDLLRLQLERRVLPGPVSEVSVAATGTDRLTVWQRELFGQQREQHPHQLAMLVNRLSSRLGRRRVVRPQPRAEAQPERAYRYVPMTDLGTKRKRSAPRAKAPRAADERPLRLYSPPRSIEVIAVLPDGPPSAFFDGRDRYEITRHWGPERIQTAWWRGRSVQRDYLRVETAEGNRFWLFRRLSDLRWFLHGAF